MDDSLYDEPGEIEEDYDMRPQNTENEGWGDLLEHACPV